MRMHACVCVCVCVCVCMSEHIYGGAFFVTVIRESAAICDCGVVVSFMSLVGLGLRTLNFRLGTLKSFVIITPTFTPNLKSPAQVQLLNSEDMTASQMSTDLSQNQYQPAPSAPLQASMSILQSLAHSHGSSVGGGGEAVQEFESLRHTLLEQQQKELEELFVQQRREQMLLQGEIEEHHKRMRVGRALGLLLSLPRCLVDWVVD